MLLTCKGWYAALTAEPRLMPTAVFEGWKAQLPLPDEDEDCTACSRLTAKEAMFEGHKQRAWVLELAASLSPRTGRVMLINMDRQVSRSCTTLAGAWHAAATPAAVI